MAIVRRQIQGTVLKPDGSGHDGGHIRIGLSVSSGITNDDTTSDVYVVGGIIKIPINVDGFVDFYLVPNDEIIPANSAWVAVYALPGRYTFRETWLVESGVGVLQLGDIVRIPGYITEASILVATLPTPSIKYRGKLRTVMGATDEQDVTSQCLKGWDNNYHWVPAILGGNG